MQVDEKYAEKLDTLDFQEIFNDWPF